MPCHLVKLVACCALVSVAAAPAAASVRLPGATGINDNTDFPCIGRVDTPNGTGTGTVIGNGMWVLTSRHVVCDENNMPLAAGGLRFRNGAGGVTSHTVNMVICHPTVDIAILKLDDMLDGSYTTAAAAIPNGTMFCTAGFGLTSSNAGTPNATWDADSHARRVYYNTVNNGAISYDGVPASTYDFSCPPGPPVPVNGEGIGAYGDSGQPMLISRPGGGFDIRGVYVGQIVPPGGQDGPTWGATGVFINITDNLQTWITTNIPAPGTATVLALALFAAPRRRAK